MKQKNIMILALVLSLPLQAKAAVLFTVAGTITSTGLGDRLGYTIGQAVSFTFETTNNYGDNGSSHFTASENSWEDEIVPDANLWNSVGGTGLVGSFVRPTATYNDPFSTIEIEPSIYSGTDSLFRFNVNADDSTSIGLQGPSGSDLRSIQVVVMANFGFNFPETYTSPEDYFEDFQGIWSVSNLSSVTLQNSGNLAMVKVTSASITVTAVPEPSTYALLGLGSLALIMSRRALLNRAREKQLSKVKATESNSSSI